MDMVVYPQQNVAELIQNEFLPIRLTPETPDVFRAYAVHTVPAFVVTDADGLECERRSGFLDAEGLASFCLLALGKFYHDHHATEKARQYLERLISAHPKSIDAPESIFLRGVYQYIVSQNPLRLRDAFLMLAQNYPDSVWVRRSLVLYFHPSAITDWEDFRKRRLDYWESKDAFLKAYATYYNGPSGHQIKNS